MPHKLLSLGFSDSAIVWFKTYQSKRTRTICVNGFLSEPQSIQLGVPQGSILGPLLFIMCTNDLPSVFHHCKIQLFADDPLLFFSGSSIEEIETYLSADLSNIISWLLNYSKK